MLRRSFKKLSKSILWRFFPQIKAYSIPYRARFFWGAGAAWGRPNGRPQRRGVRGAALAALRAARPGQRSGREQAPPAQEPPPEPLSGPAESLRLSAGRCAAPQKNLLYSGSSFIIFSKNVMPSLIYNPEALASFSLYAERECIGFLLLLS